jgi:hypothetical protein
MKKRLKNIDVFREKLTRGEFSFPMPIISLVRNK